MFPSLEIATIHSCTGGVRVLPHMRAGVQPLAVWCHGAQFDASDVLGTVSGALATLGHTVLCQANTHDFCVRMLSQ